MLADTDECSSVDINECVSEPCLNGGLCEDGINVYICHCQDGFLGSACETGKLINQSINNQSINQSIDQSINQSIGRSIINQSLTVCR